MTAVEIDPASPPTRGELLALTPAAGIHPRPHRYVGDTVFAAMHELAEDAAVVRRLYAFLQAILAAVHRPDAPEALPDLGRLLVRSDYGTLCEEIGRLGAALSAEDTPMTLRKVYHDVRGGSLNALLMHLDLAEAGEAADLSGDLGRIFAGGYTTGGHGVGLQICSDIISHGYGLGSASAAVSGGYLGARLVREHFVAWFHWPAQRAKSLSGV